MKKVFLGLLAVIGITGFFIFTTGESASEPKAEFSYATVQQSIDAGGQLLDVRTPEEFADGHIVDAVNLSLQDIQAGTYPSGSKDDAIHLYCRSGNRSAQAARLLSDAGYTNVVDLGGIDDVRALGGLVQ